MMCDDHVVTQSSMDLDRYYELMFSDDKLGRLQLSPPSGNYLNYIRKRHSQQAIPDYSLPYNLYPTSYRWHVNFQPALWRKEFFEYCVQGGENRNKLEMRAAARGRKHPHFRSGFIFEEAVQVDNFYASCKVHTADPAYNRMKNSPHYREEFVQYAQRHSIALKPEQSVYVKRSDFVASVPQPEYMKHMNDEHALREYAVRSSRLRSLYAKAADQVKVAIGA